MQERPSNPPAPGMLEVLIVLNGKDMQRKQGKGMRLALQRIKS